jgi:hypothetical protein
LQKPEICPKSLTDYGYGTEILLDTLAFYPTGARSMNRLAQLLFVNLCLLVFSAEDQTGTLPPGLPTFANITQLYEYQATNKQNFVGVATYYTPSTPGGANVRLNLAALTTFVSLDQLDNFIITNAIGEIGSITNANLLAQASLHVRVFSSLYQPYDSMDIDVTNDTLSGMAEQWISNHLTPDYVFVNINVPGLQSFDIQIQTITNTYSYHTNLISQTGSIVYVPPLVGTPPYPSEGTTLGYASSGWPVLNPWYLMQTNRARFTVTTTTGSQRYTQMGAAMLPPTAAMSGALIQASVAAGSDVTLLCSDSITRPMSTWQTNSVCPWSLNTNMIKWNVGLTNHAGFFMIRLN